MAGILEQVRRIERASIRVEQALWDLEDVMQQDPGLVPVLAADDGPVVALQGAKKELGELCERSLQSA